MQTRRNIYTACLLIGVLLLTGFGLTSCEKEKIDTKIILNSFGPSPALRGGELRFIGNNLDKVTSIILPGLKESTTVEVTDITVVNEREIKIEIPQDAGEGIVTLKTPQGDIKTNTPITYSEPIMIESVTPTTIKAGQTLTITGDYLNLIKSVIFFDNVSVADSVFISQTRKKIEVTVPAEAQTGKIILSNGEEIPIEIYSKETVNIVLPTITSIAPTTIKPGATLTITGKDLDLVSKVEFAGGKIIPTFTVSKDGTTITVTVPNDAQDGIIKLIAKSVVSVESTDKLTMVMPSNLVVTPTEVKNKGSMTISGTNLDLVSEIKFGTLIAAITNKTATQITLTVPEEATATVATLVTLSTKTVDTPAFTYIKPTITALTPTTLMAGTDLTITGTDLDLVKQVKFPSSAKIVDVTPASATSFVVTVPTDATSGNVTLITINGTEVVSPMTLTVTAADIPVITSMPSVIKPEQLLVIQGTKLNLVESVIFENGIKAVNFGTRSETTLEVYVPEDALKGANEIQFVTFSGKIVKATVNIMGTDPILPTTVMLTNFNGGGNSQSTWGTPFSFGIPSIPLDGTACMIGNSNVSGWTWSWAANWGTLPALSDPDLYVFKMDICITKPVLSGVSAGMCFRGWDNSITLGNIFATSTDGNWITLKFNLNPGNPINGTGDFGFYLSCSETIDLSGVYIDNFRFDLK
ncbi:MAG TPA: IPT/TIG domain-containing protein [Paludibacter sp.]|nr:MAG: IPT/TIG domain protein [Bacteroidetes bacterium ADurb.Bin174]HQB27554.1 IPT/TIG domain-containing protein [Paludibacter sp.]